MRPFPGGELALRVAGTTDRDWFFESGRRSVDEVAAVLALAGRTFGDYELEHVSEPGDAYQRGAHPVRDRQRRRWRRGGG